MRVNTNDDYNNLKEFLKNGVIPKFKQRMEKARFLKIVGKFSIINKKIYFKDKKNQMLEVVLPEDVDLINSIIKKEHTISHLGILLFNFRQKQNLA